MTVCLYTGILTAAKNGCETGFIGLQITHPTLTRGKDLIMHHTFQFQNQLHFLEGLMSIDTPHEVGVKRVKKVGVKRVKKAPNIGQKTLFSRNLRLFL